MKESINLGQITDSMADGYANRLNDDCFYFQVTKKQKEFIEENTEFFKSYIAGKYEKTVSNFEFDDYLDFWCVGVNFE